MLGYPIGEKMTMRSRPTRGAWIEISVDNFLQVLENGRAPHGARGLKCRKNGNVLHLHRRAPHGARGLKCDYFGLGFKDAVVAPHTGRVD